jgi:hypothetical protein
MLALGREIVGLDNTESRFYIYNEWSNFRQEGFAVIYNNPFSDRFFPQGHKTRWHA